MLKKSRKKLKTSVIFRSLNLWEKWRFFWKILGPFYTKPMYIRSFYPRLLETPFFLSIWGCQAKLAASPDQRYRFRAKSLLHCSAAGGFCLPTTSTLSLSLLACFASFCCCCTTPVSLFSVCHAPRETICSISHIIRKVETTSSWKYRRRPPRQPQIRTRFGEIPGRYFSPQDFD